MPEGHERLDPVSRQDIEKYDLVIYGGTAGGLMAAISAAREGASVVVLEPSDHIGGMVTGGLGHTDIGVASSIGGMVSEFYQRIHAHYNDPTNWPFDDRDAFLTRPGLGRHIVDDRWWFHEPSVASSIFRKMCDEVDLDVRTGHRLERVEKRGMRILSMQCENAVRVHGRVFIDATYEGDLLALAGVKYRVGRESVDEYGEAYAGILPLSISTRKQWDVDISPYDDNGRLLFGVQDTEYGTVGAGDSKVQAYNYRICLTDHPDNRLPIEEPANYDPKRYDLLARYIAARPDISVAQRGRRYGMVKLDRLPNRKTDLNDGGPFSLDFIGYNWDYPEGDRETRAGILQHHVDYTKGLLYFIGHDPRLPDDLRNEMRQWGYPKDEFVDTDHWTPQLYVREARRMVGAYVMTSHDLETNRTKADTIGMGSYPADSHNCQRIVHNGFVRNEGNPNDFTPGSKVYEIPYRAITPQQAECDNLLVTFCVSASHMGFASVRMEPVFMMLSESAGLAAVEAVRTDTAVQDVSYAQLRPQLLRRKQRLSIHDVEDH